MARGWPNVYGDNAVLCKFDNFGALKYSTYLGGLDGMTQGFDVAVDSSYQMYVVGRTSSYSMTTQFTSAVPTLSFAGNSSTLAANVATGLPNNAFIAKISPNGNVLRMCSYYGGKKQEHFTCIKYWQGQIHIGGVSTSTSVPTMTILSTAYTTTLGTGLYLHLDTTMKVKLATKIHYPIKDLDIDKNGNTYIISSGTGTLAPIRRFSTSTYTAINQGQSDWVLQRFGQNDSLTWSTYIGGNQNDSINGICVKDTLLAMIGAGGTNFPVVKAVSDSGYTAPFTTNDLQMMKINTKTGQILWSAYHKGCIGTGTRGVALDNYYNLFISGMSYGTNSIRNLALTGYYQQTTNIGHDGYLIGFTNTNKRRWTSYLGSLSSTNSTYSDDVLYGMTISKSNRMFVCGYLNVVNNSFPFAKWNNSCWFDSIAYNPGPSQGIFREEGLFAMFEAPNLLIAGIKEYAKNRKTNIILYPNPNSGIFNLRFSNSVDEKLKVNVMNIVGQIVFKSDAVTLVDNEYKIDLNSLSKGVYLITLSSKTSIETLKFVIE